MTISDTTMGTDGKSRKEFLLTKNCNSCWNIYQIEIFTINFHVLLLLFFLSPICLDSKWQVSAPFVLLAK